MYDLLFAFRELHCLCRWKSCLFREILEPDQPFVNVELKIRTTGVCKACTFVSSPSFAALWLSHLRLSQEWDVSLPLLVFFQFTRAQACRPSSGISLRIQCLRYLYSGIKLLSQINLEVDILPLADHIYIDHFLIDYLPRPRDSWCHNMTIYHLFCHNARGESLDNLLPSD